LPPAVSVLCGPLILRKIGLEEYALASLALYFFSLIAIYADFGSYSHLLAGFLKQAPDRLADLGTALALRLGLLAVFSVVLLLFALKHPRQDILYVLIAMYMAVIALPVVNFELYFNARRMFFKYFQVRLLLNGLTAVCIVAWYFSPWRSALFLPAINFVATAAVARYAFWYFGAGSVGRVFSILGLVSFRGLRRYVARTLAIG
jgi:O-antigen/teichoic acid export membrane protein